MNNIKIIVAVDQNNGIGYKGNLLFHIKEDFKNFVKKTKGKYKKRTDKIENSLIIGKNTFLSFPKRKSGSRALLHRHNCVVGNILTEEIKKEMSDGNILFVNSLKKALRKTRDRKEIWIGGGSRIYKESAYFRAKNNQTKTLTSA